MPPRKQKTPAGRSVGAEARNPFALSADDPGPVSAGQTSPVRRFIVPPTAPMPEFRAHGHVLTERGWVREEGNHDG